MNFYFNGGLFLPILPPPLGGSRNVSSFHNFRYCDIGVSLNDSHGITNLSSPS